MNPIKIQIQVKALLEPLKVVISAVESKPTLPILSHVLIELNKGKLTLTTTDLEIELRAWQTIDEQAKVSFTIYAKDLIDIIKNLAQETLIEFIIEKTKIYIKTNNNSFELNTFNHQDFPALPEVKDSDTIVIKRENLIQLIKNTSFSMGNQDIRLYLNGLYLEINPDSIVAVATDGHRLSIGKIEQNNNIETKKTVVLPRKAVNALSNILEKSNQNEIAINLAKNYFYLISDTTTIISRLIDGNFPNYQQVIPTNYENTVIINRQSFLDSLMQASIFVDHRTKGVKLLFKETQLHIFSHSERGQAKTQIETRNFDKEIEIAFNIQYLISILEKLITEEINIIIPNGENKSCLLTNMDSEIYQYIVMPIKI